MKSIVAGAIVVVLGVIQPAPTLAAPSCDGHPATIVGTAGADEIAGTPGDDVIVALGGDDVVFGNDGADLICGGKGDDQLIGQPGEDVLRGDDGNDRLQGQVGPDVLMGGRGDDRLLGAGGEDRLLGNGGADVLLGERSDDRLEGGYGRDLLQGGGDDDRLDGGGGHDACFQGSGRGRMIGCENVYADLAIVTLSCPSTATLDVPFDCQVTLANHGPRAAHALLEAWLPPRDPDCINFCRLYQLESMTFHTVSHPDAGAPLAADGERTDVIEVTITRWPVNQTGPRVVIGIRPLDVFDAIDTTPSNDVAGTPIERA